MILCTERTTHKDSDNLLHNLTFLVKEGNEGPQVAQKSSLPQMLLAEAERTESN